MIIKAPLLVPKGAAAITIWPFIFVDRRPNRVPRHIIEHEKVHLRQQVKYLFIGFALLYFCSRRWRYRFELEAYRVSVRCGQTLDSAAAHLSGPLYGNLVTKAQAKQDLAMRW